MNGLIEKWKAERERKAFLALDDGTVFRGVAFGAAVDRVGEVVFNTGMSGYQEILTDPSYAGQFVTLTTAEVGNYGINADDVESQRLFLSGLVIGDLTKPSNWRSKESLDDYLKENGVPGIYGVDTRALAIHLRDHGNRKAYLCVSAPLQKNEAIEKAQEWEGLDGQDYAAKVTCEKPYEFSSAESFPHIVCYDFGVKTNILRSLASWARVTVVSAKTPAKDVLAMNPDGVFLSNGPADPAANGNLFGASTAVARMRREDDAAQVRASRLQPPRKEHRDRQGGDNEPEPQLRSRSRDCARLSSGNACKPQRQLD